MAVINKNSQTIADFSPETKTSVIINTNKKMSVHSDTTDPIITLATPESSYILLLHGISSLYATAF